MRTALTPLALELPLLSPAARARLAIHVPLPIASRLDRRYLDWAAELRRVTAVFLAVQGLDPAATDILQRLEEVAATLGPVVRRHDGFVQHVRVNDGGASLLVLFGIPPVAHFDDAARAVRCAIDLRVAMRGLAQRSSFGIATGRVFCGLIGNDTFRVWTIYGDAINLAARLKDLQQGTIQCDDATMRGARDGVAFVPLGGSQIRGLGATVSVWTPRRQDRVAVGVPMHGREQELASLRSAFHAATSGHAKLVLIEADCGMGKSRLLAEFRQQAAADGAMVLTGQADSIERHVPYRCWRGIVAQLLRLDSATHASNQPEQALAALGPEFSPRAALLNPLLQFALPETAETQVLAPMQRAPLRLSLLLGLLRRAASACPLLVTIDDAHWLDDESWSLVQTALAEIRNCCLVLAMHRWRMRTGCGR